MTVHISYNILLFLYFTNKNQYNIISNQTEDISQAYLILINERLQLLLKPFFLKYLILKCEHFIVFM